MCGGTSTTIALKASSPTGRKEEVAAFSPGQMAEIAAFDTVIVECEGDSFSRWSSIVSSWISEPTMEVRFKNSPPEIRLTPNFIFCTSASVVLEDVTRQFKLIQIDSTCKLLTGTKEIK